MDTIYVENTIAHHARVKTILTRFPKARVIAIERYTDVFNAPSQNFRTQKANPALILAYKHGNKVLPTPPDYHIGGAHNYYFSHMLNCIYDCRYCFLQGMYRSANYVVFVNYEDFFTDIAEQMQQHGEQESWFFSGYDCDSLALEPVTEFIAACLDQFEKLPCANLEIRTKSTQIRQLLSRQAIPNCVIAYSLSPEPIVAAEEHKTASLEKRITALKALQDHGWKVGLRFDPILKATNAQALYADMFDAVFEQLETSKIHSISLGPFRLPTQFYKKMIRLYPESKLLSTNLTASNNMLSYDPETENSLLKFCETRILKTVKPDQYFPCVSVS